MRVVNFGMTKCHQNFCFNDEVGLEVNENTSEVHQSVKN